MAAIQDPLTEDISNAIGMTTAQAENNLRLAARRAGKVLRANGFHRSYCNESWNRGMRWFAPSHGYTRPEPDKCATSMLGIALIAGEIVTRWSDLVRLGRTA